MRWEPAKISEELKQLPVGVGAHDDKVELLDGVAAAFRASVSVSEVGI